MTENTTSDGTTAQPVAQPTTAMPVGAPTMPSTPASQPVSDNWYDKFTTDCKGISRPIRNRRRRNSNAQGNQHRLPNATRATTSNCPG